MDVYVKQKRIALDPAASIGKGGEADVFDLGDGSVLKLWKTPLPTPTTPGSPPSRTPRASASRCTRPSSALSPEGMPDGVVAPLELATDRSGKLLVGYSMPYVAGAEVLLRYGDPSCRRGGLAAGDAIAALADLHATVARAARAGDHHR